MHGDYVPRGGAEEQAVQYRFNRLKRFIKEKDDDDIADLLTKSVEIARKKGLSWSYETALSAATASFPPEAAGLHMMSLAETLAALVTLASE